MSPSRSPLVGASGLAALLGVVVVTLAAFGDWRSDSTVFPATGASLRVDAVVGEAHTILAVEPVVIDDPASGAAEALGGYALAAGVADAQGWTIDLGATGEAAGAIADRVAHGLLARGLEFERTGEGWSVFRGEGPLPPVRPGDDPGTVLAAVVEVSGSPDGAIVAADAPTPARSGSLAAIAELAAGLGLDPFVGDGTIRLARRHDRAAVAALAYRCRNRVPLSDGSGCGEATPPLDEIAVDSLDAWTVGVTGSLVPGAAQLPPSDQGGVGWTNAEAQRYVAEAVEASGSGLRLTASPVDGASVDELPYTSGLVVLDETIGLGVVEVDVVVPAGDGLWPAVWLLDAEACDMPGRCPAYATDAYHEIDLLETNGAVPDRAVTSLHWWDDQLRSASSAVDVAGLSDGSIHTVRLERRPGLLRWLIDGVEVYSIAGPVDAGSGPHRVAPMFLVLNLAVGGNFAGDLQIGRYGQWWGDARVPASFPDVGWDRAVLEIRGVRIGPA